VQIREETEVLGQLFSGNLTLFCENYSLYHGDDFLE